ncbi:MAG: hypothetical protein AAF235_11885, partial [Planctomycetota bacterium]
GVALLSVASADVIFFDGVNHTDGGVNPQEYGLRLDNFGPDRAVTFSFESNGQSTVTIALDTDAETLRIFGDIWGNSANNGTFLGSYSLDVTISGDWDAQTGHFISTSLSSDIGTLVANNDVSGDSPLAAGESLTLGSKARGNGDVFLFGVDIPGGRLDNNDDRHEGYGWVMTDLSSGTQDFLFAAVQRPPIIPAPGTAALAGIGGLMVAGRRRR